jgi:hypothetical protein
MYTGFAYYPSAKPKSPIQRGKDDPQRKAGENRGGEERQR